MDRLSNIIDISKRIATKIIGHWQEAGYDTPEAFATAHGIDVDIYIRHEQGINMNAAYTILIMNELKLDAQTFFEELNDISKYYHLINSSKN